MKEYTVCQNTAKNVKVQACVADPDPDVWDQARIGCPFFASDKKMQNVAKTKQKDAKTNSKQARGSETKQNKVSLL
jgi:hypothetical protein